MFEQISHRLLGSGARLEIQHDPDIVGRLVPHILDLGDLACMHELADFLDEMPVGDFLDTIAAEAREALSLKSRVVVTLSEPNPKHPTWAQDLLAIDPEEGASFDPISDEDLRDIADVL